MVADPERELRAWRDTVLWLHSVGQPAPAPAFVAAWLRRQGIVVDWVTAA